jgi:hypothetical protein
VRSLVVLCIAALSVQPAAAEPLAPREVPEPLQPWVDWVLRGHEAERCPFLDGGELRVCAWPARLEIEIDDRAGRFVQIWEVHGEAQVPLPGDAKRWPQEVTLDGAAAPVIASGERPSVRLARGRHELRGSFRWDAIPELLQIPPETGIVRLRVRGREVSAPDRDAEGRLWLTRGAGTTGEGAKEELEISVHRLIADEVPLLLETRVRLRVSGRSREVVLGKALPAGFEPLSLAAPIPLRLDPDGRLRAQVRAGTWDAVLLARHVGRAERIALADPGGAWDASEEWVFEARPALRAVAIEDALAIDPSQTTLPPEWHALPAYRMEAGSALRLVEKQRGDADPAPDQLGLERQLWLDFDGRGATASDAISGAMHRSARLEMRPGTELGRAALDGSDQLITKLEGREQIGIEVPPGPVSLSADSRVALSGSGPVRRLSAVGWDADFQSLHASLELPPGWRLFHASGVDRAGTSWIETWTLLDVFAVIVLSLGFGRLWGGRFGALAVIGLVLLWNEPGAPQWAWVATLAGEALLRVLPEGRVPRFRRTVALYRGLALGVLVLIALPFAVRQVRSALYPALERPWQTTEPVQQLEMGALAGAARDRAAAQIEAPAAAAMERRVKAFSGAPGRPTRGAPSSMAELEPMYAPDPKASVTTGPGLPSWSWTRVALQWSGPVQRSQELTLFLLSPFANGLLGFARVALLAALVACALGVPTAVLGRWLRRAAARAGAIALLCLPATAHADLPSPELLDELRRRLLEAPACQPHCAVISRLGLEIEPRALRARLEIQAQAETAIALPGGARGFSPERVLVGGQPAAGLVRQPDGNLWLRVSPGRSEVIAEGALPERDSLELALPSLPRRVELQARGWTVHGVREDGVPEPTLQLERILENGQQARAGLERGELPPFVRIERHLQLGLEWHATTQVMRLSPADTALALSIPLLPGESITSAGVRAENGSARVTLPPGTTMASWTSVLHERPELALRAGSEPWSSEVWRLDASPVWHLEIAGIPTLHQPGARIREWHPWPGEEVQLSVRRPAGIEGSTATLDAAVLALQPGLRSTEAQLQLALRSSRGGQHTLLLPEGAELLRVAIDGAEHALRQQERAVTLPLRPGAQAIELGWREPRGARALRFAGSEVDLGLPAVNAEVHLTPSPARWTLYATGPRLGPSVLFWPLLGVFALISLALGRLSSASGLTPLRTRHWFGLGIGLTQVPVAAAACVSVWLLLLGWRGRHGVEIRGRWFDLLQLALGALTLAAAIVIFQTIRQGLLGEPDMQIAGNASYAELLRWYQDRSGAGMPQPQLFSVPRWVYRAAMLGWALWLAWSLLAWLRWGWECFSSGELWRPLRRPRVAQ